MQTIRYIGPFDVVEFEHAPKTWTEVAHGDTVQVADDLAAQLLEQTDNWELATAPKARKQRAPKAAAVPESDPAPTPEPAPVSDDSTPQEG